MFFVLAMYVIVLTFLEQIKSLPSTQLHQRGMTASYILTFNLIPCHAEYFHVLHSQIYQLNPAAFQVNRNRLCQFRGIKPRMYIEDLL